jgi:hypothetical protein
MTRKQNRIMVWIIVWAGLFIVVLYSPVGSPELYTSENYIAENQYVGFKKGEIHNAPKINSTYTTSSDESVVPDMNLEIKSNYSIRNYQSTALSSHESYSGMQNQSYHNYTSSGGNISGIGATVLANRSSVKSEGSSGIIMTNGIASLSTTTNLSGTTTRQSANATETSVGATDPGGDPTGPAIPVGNGLGLLLLFGVLYSLIKSKDIYNRLYKRDCK